MLNENPMTIALHGAGGAQGTPLARRLLRAGHRVRAVVRRPERTPAGCVPAAADLSDAAALARAYDGADAVVIQLPTVFDAVATRQAEAVAEALRRSPVGHVVFNAGGPTGGAGLPYLDARTMLAQALAAGPIPAAIVQPFGQYMENLCAPWSAPAVRAGVLAYPVPAEAAIPWVAIEDVAERIDCALAGREEGDLPICGPEMLPGDQAAAALATALGRPVQYRQVSPAEFGDMIRAAAGDALGDGIAELYTGMLAGGPPPAPDPGRLRIGPTALADWARRQHWGEALAA